MVVTRIDVVVLMPSDGVSEESVVDEMGSEVWLEMGGSEVELPEVETESDVRVDDDLTDVKSDDETPELCLVELTSEITDEFVGTEITGVFEEETIVSDRLVLSEDVPGPPEVLEMILKDITSEGVFRGAVELMSAEVAEDVGPPDERDADEGGVPDGANGVEADKSVDDDGMTPERIGRGEEPVLDGNVVVFLNESEGDAPIGVFSKSCADAAQGKERPAPSRDKAWENLIIND
jgi:hypothetical protein